MKNKKQKNPTFSRLIRTVTKGHKTQFCIVILCILISSVTSVLASTYIKRIIDDFISPMLQSGSRDFSGLIKSVLTMGGIFCIGIVASFTYKFIMVFISESVLRDIRHNMFAKMQKLPIKYFDTHTHGDIMSHYTNDIEVLENMISDSIPMIISSGITIVTVFCAMLYLSVYLTLVVIAFLLFILVITKSLGKKSRKYFVGLQSSLGTTTGYIQEMTAGQKVIKVFNHEDKVINQFDKLNEELYQNTMKANKYANIFMPVMSNISNLQYVFLAIIGGILMVYNIPNLTIIGFSAIGVGTIASFLQLGRAFSMPLSQLSQQVNSIIRAIAGAERIFSLIDEKPEVDNGYITLVNVIKNKKGTLEETKERTNLWAWKDPTKAENEQLTELKGDVRLFEVDFGYTEGVNVLHDISLYAKPGQKIAFVGATGAGKTTITNLLNRFYDIADGKIKYDGININKIKKDDLRRSIGMVLQDTNLFTGTVKENIRYGNLDATDEQIYEAAKLAGADDFVRRLPNGYDTRLESDGANLSQGQRQLLSIARAAVANAPVMILDEATSSIDTHTEKLVQRGMDALMKNRTTFVIAHRLSTVQDANVIMVLDHGKIIEKGTHEQLIAEKGKYYELYTGKFELE